MKCTFGLTNSDDIVIFDTSVSEEYVHLLNAGVFSASELNEIRENGLSCDAYCHVGCRSGNPSCDKEDMGHESERGEANKGHLA